MSNRVYGQYCGFARALEVVGERWTLLIVRDLLIAPRRFTDLLRGLTGIPSNVLTARLKDLETAGVIRRSAQPPPERSVVYELTEYGRDLQETVDALGRWGAKRLADPRPGEIITVESMLTALRSTFQRSAARGARVSYELRLGDIVLHARVADSKLSTAAGPLADADLAITAGPRIRALLAGEVTPQEALAKKIVSVRGDVALLERFARTFRIDPLGAGSAAKSPRGSGRSAL